MRWSSALLLLLMATTPTATQAEEQWWVDATAGCISSYAAAEDWHINQNANYLTNIVGYGTQAQRDAVAAYVGPRMYEHFMELTFGAEQALQNVIDKSDTLTQFEGTSAFHWHVIPYLNAYAEYLTHFNELERIGSEVEHYLNTEIEEMFFPEWPEPIDPHPTWIWGEPGGSGGPGGP